MKVLYRYWCLCVYTISFRMLLSLALLVSWSPLWTAGAVIAVRVIAVRIWLLERAALNLWARVRWSTLWAPRAVIAVRVWLHGRHIMSLWARVRWSSLWTCRAVKGFWVIAVWVWLLGWCILSALNLWAKGRWLNFWTRRVWLLRRYFLVTLDLCVLEFCLAIAMTFLKCILIALRVKHILHWHI